MTLQKYFIDSEFWNGDEIVITGEDTHHIVRVMRSKLGDEIICNKPDGTAAICEITEIKEKQVIAKVKSWLESSAELPVHVTIAQGLPKGDKLELILQKGTELGASAFIPFQADRSIVIWDERKAAKRIKRFEKIVKEASEQSQRNILPTVHSPETLRELVEKSGHYDVKIFAYEEEAKVDDYRSFGTIVKQLREGEQILIVIGPEGGFSEKEVAFLKENDFHSVRLGPRILRTETAPLYALASISYHFEES